jgi:hypothetical protein
VAALYLLGKICPRAQSLGVIPLLWRVPILARLKQPYHIQRLPWSEVHARAKTAALGAGCDMILDISATSRAPTVPLYFTQPIYQLYYSLVYSNTTGVFSSTKYTRSSKNITNYKICGVDSYNYGVLE